MPPLDPPAAQPCLTILWNELTQHVTLEFDTSKTGPFRNWSFVLAILDMAKREAETQRSFALALDMQRQQQGVMQQAKILNELNELRRKS